MITFSQMLSDLIASVFNIDNKAFKTLFTLFRPGSLSLKYIEGKRKSYSNPIKFYLFLSFILFGLISYQFDNVFKHSDFFQKLDTRKSLRDKERIFDLDSLSNLISQNSSNQDYIQGAKSLLYLDIANNLNPLTADTFETAISEIRFDGEEFPIVKLEKTDSIFLNYSEMNEKHSEYADVYNQELNKYLKPDSISLFLTNERVGKNKTNIKFSMEDLVLLPSSKVIEKYEIKKFWKQLYVSQAMKIVKDPANAFYFALTGFSWIALLFVPLMALWLKLLYIRRKKYFIEHLVFTLHSVSFLFIMIFLIQLINIFFNWSWASVLLLILPIYLYLATRTFYKQSKFKSFIKTILNGFISLVFIQLLLLISIFFRILLF